MLFGHNEFRRELCRIRSFSRRAGAVGIRLGWNSIEPSLSRVSKSSRAEFNFATGCRFGRICSKCFILPTSDQRARRLQNPTWFGNIFLARGNGRQNVKDWHTDHAGRRYRTGSGERWRVLFSVPGEFGGTQPAWVTHSNSLDRLLRHQTLGLLEQEAGKQAVAPMRHVGVEAEIFLNAVFSLLQSKFRLQIISELPEGHG